MQATMQVYLEANGVQGGPKFTKDIMVIASETCLLGSAGIWQNGPKVWEGEERERTINVKEGTAMHRQVHVLYGHGYTRANTEEHACSFKIHTQKRPEGTRVICSNLMMGELVNEPTGAGRESLRTHCRSRNCYSDAKALLNVKIWSAALTALPGRLKAIQVLSNKARLDERYSASDKSCSRNGRANNILALISTIAAYPQIYWGSIGAPEFLYQAGNKRSGVVPASRIGASAERVGSVG
ncbi:hypothetical protein B0H10DRAFT_2187513 [Mycena sp. CBHHK59/15]|nr:hypothetical protein B0H10DRAFT_2187513 [Mycena sp. CBHHK59/15]